MATFRVGQRVRFVAHSGVKLFAPPAFVLPLGAEGVVSDGPRMLFPSNAAPFFGYIVHFPGWGDRSMGAYQLVPLTDPSADAFIERLKKLVREPVNVTVKERA